MTIFLAVAATLLLAVVVGFVVVRAARDRQAAAEKAAVDAEARAAARAEQLSIAEEFDVLREDPLPKKIRRAMERDRS